MKKSLRKRLKKYSIVLLLGFLTLFFFRLVYGYTKVIESTLDPIPMAENIIDTEIRKNYASKKYKTNNAGPSAIRIDQKYEKIADIRTVSPKFNTHEKRLRKQIAAYNALIQFEHKSGNQGHRQLNLSIGVPPENFDSIYQKLIKIGKVSAKQITKKDKTNEYRELNAKKSSLEKVRNSLIDLKLKGGDIEEYIQLENRILEIERQLQELGVSLGNFDDENEFCTVRFSLSEGTELQIGFLQRIKVALEWTVKTYLQLMAILMFLSLSSYLLALTLDKMKVLGASSGKDQKDL
ncbi:MAG: DUF4349 domain-containing protein [Bacteroidota bacterium]